MSDEIKKGLVGVISDETKVSEVMPEINSLTYRGYAVQDLAKQCRFEQVAYLLLHGELPSDEELKKFEQAERSNRTISNTLKNIIKNYPNNAHPMDTTRTSVSHMGLEDPDTADNSPAANMRKAMRLLAQISTAVAANFRSRKGQEIIEPDPNLNFCENFFHMCFGTVPSPEVVKAFDVSMTLYAEHSFNASTFTAPGSFSETVEYVVVAGAGGGGAGNNGGGGGAGGYRTGTTPVSGPTTVSVQVGAGGIGTKNIPSAVQGGSGTDSYFGVPITSTGGGGGGNNAPTNGASGGSGGGGGNSGQPGGAGNTPPTSPPQGNPGGAGYPGSGLPAASGGGGGAGQAGTPGVPGTGGAGGYGLQAPSTFRNPQSTTGLGAPGPGGVYYFAGGGAGGHHYNPPSSGGYGGGGNSGDGAGATLAATSGQDGIMSTGGGAGGGSYSSTTAAGGTGGNGGSGIVLIAYPS